MGSNARASGNGTHLNASDPSIYDPDGQNPISVFSIQNLSGGDLTTLVPSADGATTDAATESLVITGNFGSAQGEVSVEGIGLTVKKWTSTRITTTLPKASGKALITSKSGLLSNRIDDIGAMGDPNVGPPYILISLATTQIINPTDYSFTVNDVPYPYDLGDAVALVVAYRSWDTSDTSSTIAARNTAFVDTTTAKTQVTAGLVYP